MENPRKKKNSEELENVISIIVPIYNGGQWIDSCFTSIKKQILNDQIQVEICICNDASTDNTQDILDLWKDKFGEQFSVKIYRNSTGKPLGVGWAKNRAVEISTGRYLCFQDIDDLMSPTRLIEQYKRAIELPRNTLIGSQFERVPGNSTIRYTNWANSLSESQLFTQIYTSHGPTLIMPTWFCHQSVFENVGGFSEEGQGTPEDLIFFYKHLDLAGKLYRVDRNLLVYTYHPLATSLSVHENTIWKIRVERLQRKILANWDSFTIWNAGKQGRKFYNSLTSPNKNKVVRFCDVDKNKIGKLYTAFDEKSRKVDRSIPIVHFTEALSPFVICVKLGLTNGEFEDNLNSLNLMENEDYVLFS